MRKHYKGLGVQKWQCEAVPAAESSDPKYGCWVERQQPSALSAFQRMMSSAEGKQIVVFLDYDGTLSPIVNDPERAFMSDLMRSALRQVAARFPTAIISGRSRQKVYDFVKLDQVYYAGSHGMDIMGPPAVHTRSYNQTFSLDQKVDKFLQGNGTTIFQPAKEYLPTIKKMLNELRKQTCSVSGAFVEDNGFCISVHYRHVLDQDYDMLEGIVHGILRDYPSFHLTQGKKVLEIRPSIKWNKGDAIIYLLDNLGFSDLTTVLPFYIGDDRTDEDAFKVLRSQGQGYPIIVTSVPRETSATHSLRDPSEVQTFLIRLARW